MSISRNDALAALNEVKRAEARSLDTRVYRTTGIMLIGWGVVWMVGYSLTALAPHWASVIWSVGVTAGILFSFMVKRRRIGKDATPAWRWAVISLAIFLFFGATYTVLPIRSSASAAVFPALLVALVYAIAGGLRFTRLLWIAAALFVLTMGGFLYLKPILMFWMAAVGGGALVLGGLWLAKA
ncbi:MAG: hypothetical protein ABIO37_18735 [Caulobacteraceae bacterium]